MNSRSSTDMGGSVTELEPQKFSLLNDEPVGELEADLLEAATAAKQLADLLVASRDSTPITLAVEGGWGMGKSSLMRLVDAELTRAPDVHTVWYNAWTSTGADALEGLIKSVLMRFDRRVLRRALQRVSEHRALVRAARALAMLVAGPLGVARLADEFWRSLSVSPQARNEMRDAIRDVAQEWAESAEFAPRRLLVVFVDDLDRCSEDTVLAVCEAMKIYLDVPGLAFVVGCDRSALTANGLLRDLSPAGSAFMEKIFQTSYRLPVPSGNWIEAFVRRCARDSGIHALLNDGLVALVAERAGRNPRRIKKLINGFVLEMGLNPLWRDSGPRAVDIAARTLLLQHLYPGFYRMLVGSSAAYGDVLTEFSAYRRVRRALRQVAGDISGDADLVRFFEEHEVRLPEPQDAEARVDALVALEEQLPTGFPALAADRGFLSLIDDLTEIPGAAEAIRQLRQQPLRRAAPWAAAPDATADGIEGTLPGLGPVEHTAEVTEDGDEPGEQPLAGLRILWIDDRPANNDFQAEVMRRAGAQVVVAATRAEAERRLAAQHPDLLISDITRGTDKEAGFRLVEAFRDAGTFLGPVIFYTGRVTPAREGRARSLGAVGITAGSGALHRLVAAVAKQRAEGSRSG
jgi:CheY-like chemotaxis protein